MEGRRSDVADDEVSPEWGGPGGHGASDLPGEPVLPEVPVQPLTVRFQRRAGAGSPVPVFKPTRSTALEEDDPDSSIPPPALWVMKYRRRLSLRHRDDRLRAQLGADQSTVYAIDDGESHVMVSRQVGVDQDSVEYFLVGRMSLEVYGDFVAGREAVDDIFSAASDLALCSAYAALDAVSNVVLVDRYKRMDEVPDDYLPSSPLIEFTTDA
jgi:hypothetical protein